MATPPEKDILQTQSRDGQAEKLNYTIDENSTAAQRYSRLFV